MTDATIHLRVPALTKARWVRESRSASLRLRDWISQKVETETGNDSDMTIDDLRRWQREMGFTYDTASKTLGVGRQTYSNWLAGRSPIPGPVDLACAAIAEQLEPYSAREHCNISQDGRK